MSTFSHTDWTVICDYPLCGRQERTDTLGIQDATAADVRRYLRRQGWIVAKPHPNLEVRRRLDYCPDHKPQPEEGGSMERSEQRECAGCGEPLDRADQGELCIACRSAR